MGSDKLFKVGDYIQAFNDMTGQSLPCGPIYQSAGLQVHIRKRHPDELRNLSKIPDILKSPDYIGKHPREPSSIELVKDLGENVMVCVKLDADENYLFVASVFEISNGKLNNRLNSGRLKKVDKTHEV